ncbi:MAG: Hsp33 family molecular chaperone HslO, partial [Rhodospirillaceae bacterium]
FRCRCSSEKVENTLKSFPKSELLEIADNGQVEVTCEFCKAVYMFEVDALFGSAAKGSETRH